MIDFVFGLAIAIARDASGAPIVDDAWVDRQIEQANALYAPLGVRVRWTVEKELGEPHGEMHSREDRDALSGLTERGLVSVFVVRELEDVDEPGRRRMGVCWTGKPDRKRYIVVSRIAKPTVLAHELGHLFGNPHSQVPNNLMSYTRDGGTVFLDDAQKARTVTFASRFVADAVFFDVGPPRRLY